MANRCFFEMRIKGRKIDCEDFYRDLTYSIEDYISYEGGDSNDYIMEIEGECKNSIRYSMLKTSQELSLEAKSGLLNLEIEVFGKDDECDEYVEYIYLKNGKRKEERYGKELLYIWKIELNL